MAIEIYDAEILTQSIYSVLDANLSERLSGERTLEFSLITSRSQPITPGMVAKHDGQYYNIVRVARGISGGLPVSSVTCEHISYVLNDEAYNLVTFVFEGSPTAGLSQLLAGSPFSLGIVEPTANVEVAFTEGTLNRRNAVMRFIDACGGEIEYDGYNINIRSHRGSTTRKLLMDGENVTDLSVTLDSREDTAAYEISLFKMAELDAGDEVNITYTPLGINVDTRIVGISYNPFYRYTVRVEVGDYVPNLLESTSTQLDKIKQEFRAADGQMSSRIEDAEENVSELSQTVGGFDLRIVNAESAVAALSLTVDGFDARITNAEGNISAVTQTADKISWIVESGTSAANFTLTSRTLSLVAASINLTGYVTFSALTTAGQTSINGGNITTGTIQANRIDVVSLKVATIYTTDQSRVAIKSSGTGSLYIGGDTSWNFSDTFIYGENSVRFGSYGTWNAHHLVFDTANHVIRPNTVVDWDIGSASYPMGNVYCASLTMKLNSTTTYMALSQYSIYPYSSSISYCGTAAYPFANGYINKLYLSSTCYLTASGASLYVNGDPVSVSRLSYSSSTYVDMTASKQLLPAGSDYLLGSATYYWGTCYLGATELYLGKTSGSSGSKIGFFGTAPIVRQTLSLSSNNMGYTSVTASNYLYAVNNLIGILKNKHGLIA